MIVVSDTSPILNLAAVNRLQLLRDLYEVIVVPAKVKDELLFNGVSLEPTWMLVTRAENRAQVTELLKHLDAGESEAIVVAEEIHASLPGSCLLWRFRFRLRSGFGRVSLTA